MKLGQFIGAVMMVVGSAVGGGMLALPLVAYSAGFVWSVILLFGMFVMMLYTGLLTLEMNLTLPAVNSSHSSMAAKVFGKTGQMIVWVDYILLLLSMLVAYITGESDIIIHFVAKNFHITLTPHVSQLVFALGLGSLVFFSVNAVDYCNRFLASLKGFFLAAFLVLAVPSINVKSLISFHQGFLGQAKYLLLATPTFLCVFCYHFVIPSLRLIVGDNPRDLRKVLVVSNLVALGIYAWWLAVAFGVVPLRGATGYIQLVREHGLSAGQMTQNIIHAVNCSWFAAAMNAFTNITLTTAFLGATLSMFHFLADGLKLPNTMLGRFKTIVIALGAPLLVAFYFPEGFVLMMNWSAVFTVLLCITFPALMVYRHRKLEAPQYGAYRVAGGNGWLIFTIVLSFMFIVVTVAYLTGVIPLQPVGRV